MNGAEDVKWSQFRAVRRDALIETSETRVVEKVPVEYDVARVARSQPSQAGVIWKAFEQPRALEEIRWNEVTVTIHQRLPVRRRAQHVTGLQISFVPEKVERQLHNRAPLGRSEHLVRPRRRANLVIWDASRQLGYREDQHRRRDPGPHVGAQPPEQQREPGRAEHG